MSQNTSTAPKSNRAAKAKAKTVEQPVSEIIAQAKAANDNRAIAVAAAMVANRTGLDDNAKAFVATGGESILAMDTSTTAEVATAENQLQAARDLQHKAKALMAAYAYGVTKVSKIMTQVALAKAWGMRKQDVGPIVWAGELKAKAQLTDATTVALAGYKRDGKTGAGDLAIKPGAVDAAALAAVASDPKVTTDADFRKAVTAKAKSTRAAGKKAPKNAPAAQRVYNVTLELDKIIQAGQILPDGTVKDEAKLSAVNNVSALMAKCEEYLSHHDAHVEKVSDAVAAAKARKS